MGKTSGRRGERRKDEGESEVGVRIGFASIVISPHIVIPAKAGIYNMKIPGIIFML